MLRSCFHLTFVEFRSAVSEEKSKMSHGQEGHFVFPIGRKNTNWVEDVEILLPIKFVLYRPIGKTRWPPWPLIDWDIFDFSSETTERNSTKLDRKQDLNVLYQTKFVFFGPIGKTKWPPWPVMGWDIFDFSSETTERNSTKLDRKQDLNVIYESYVFRVDRKIKMAALASDWLRHFQLLLWNHWTEFNETWQEARW